MRAMAVAAARALVRAVHARQRSRLVTSRARWWYRYAARAVRAMTRGAAHARAVPGRALARVTIGARGLCAHAARMRRVALRACAVARGRARALRSMAGLAPGWRRGRRVRATDMALRAARVPLGHASGNAGVALAARERRRGRRMRGLHVTAEALRMAAARGRARDRSMTVGARGRIGAWYERAVGLVAVGARRVAGVRALRVTRAARQRGAVRASVRGRIGMDGMAAQARTLRSIGRMRAACARVAARARHWTPDIVTAMAARARLVHARPARPGVARASAGRRSAPRAQRRLVAVTARARSDPGAREVVRRVAAHARVVSRKRGAGRHARLDGRVARGAAAIRGLPVRVHAVAIEAGRGRVAPGPAVARLLAGVARLARLRRQRGLRVRAVARAAVLVAVQRHRRDEALRLGVTAHAALGPHARVGAEAVAVLAIRGRLSENRIMQRRGHAGVARAADRARRREAGGVDVVAVAAGQPHLAHVDLMSDALAHVVPGDRHGHARRRRSGLARAQRARDQHGGDHATGRDHRAHREQHALPHDPPTWHRRHGRSVSAWRLLQPGACGLPPTPPTR